MADFDIRSVCFSYENRDVLKNISLSLESGYFYGIVGPNGCGKTTFMDLLMRHKRPTSGTILYHQQNIASYSRKSLAREMALVPQNFYINFPFTTEEIVLMGRSPHISKFSSPSSKDFEIVDNIMAKTGTDKFRNRLITELSGGERQRVIFARALVQDTPVLMLDEATSNLDINHTLRLLDILSRNVKEKQRTVIAVFQDINLASMYCDRLIFMKDRGIAGFGETEQVLTENTIRTVFNVDSKVFFEAYSGAKRVSFKKISMSA